MSEKIDKEELLKKLEDQLSKMSVKDLMAQMAANLASLGFKHLGAGEENKQFKDLEQAKLAIDGLAALYSVLENKLAKEEGSILKSALANLQFLYVQEKEKEKER